MGGEASGPWKACAHVPERSAGDGQTNTAMHATATSNNLHAINTPSKDNNETKNPRTKA